MLPLLLRQTNPLLLPVFLHQCLKWFRRGILMPSNKNIPRGQQCIFYSIHAHNLPQWAVCPSAHHTWTWALSSLPPLPCSPLLAVLRRCVHRPWQQSPRYCGAFPRVSIVHSTSAVVVFLHPAWRKWGTEVLCVKKRRLSWLRWGEAKQHAPSPPCRQQHFAFLNLVSLAGLPREPLAEFRLKGLGLLYTAVLCVPPVAHQEISVDSVRKPKRSMSWQVLRMKSKIWWCSCQPLHSPETIPIVPEFPGNSSADTEPSVLEVHTACHFVLLKSSWQPLVCNAPSLAPRVTVCRQESYMGTLFQTLNFDTHTAVWTRTAGHFTFANTNHTTSKEILLHSSRNHFTTILSFVSRTPTHCDAHLKHDCVHLQK